MNDHYKHTLSLKHWAEGDRPREKLQRQGRRSLSDAELLAVILGSGSRSESAVDLARRILSVYENDLDRVGTLGVAELIRFPGMGEAKAIGVIAAFELGRRRSALSKKELPQIGSSKDVIGLLSAVFEDLRHEEFWVVFLNRANRVLASEQISRGGQSGTIADPKIIFRRALELCAASMILCHNHPSGNRNPSSADISLTKQMAEAGVFLDIQVLDHLIFAADKHFSFADEGLM